MKQNILELKQLCHIVLLSLGRRMSESERAAIDRMREMQARHEAELQHLRERPELQRQEAPVVQGLQMQNQPMFPWNITGPYGAISLPTGPYVPPFPAGTITPTGKVVTPLQMFYGTDGKENCAAEGFMVNVSKYINQKFGDQAKGLPYDIESFKIGINLELKDQFNKNIRNEEMVGRAVFVLIPLGYTLPANDAIQVFQENSTNLFSPVEKKVVWFTQADVTTRGLSFAFHGHGKARGFVSDADDKKKIKIYQDTAVRDIAGGSCGLYLIWVPISIPTVATYSVCATLKLAKEAQLIRSPEVMTGPRKSLTITVKHGFEAAISASTSDVQGFKTYGNRTPFPIGHKRKKARRSKSMGKGPSRSTMSMSRAPSSVRMSRAPSMRWSMSTQRSPSVAQGLGRSSPAPRRPSRSVGHAVAQAVKKARRRKGQSKGHKSAQRTGSKKRSRSHSSIIHSRGGGLRRVVRNAAGMIISNKPVRKSKSRGRSGTRPI